MSDKLLSVVVPTRNRSQLLSRAILSIQKQDWPNIEIIIVDDASTDGTKDLLETLSKEDAAIRYVCNPKPSGGANARNQGIEMATGEYIAFLDDDDEWLPQKARRQIELLESDKTLSAVTCDFKILYSGMPMTRVKKIRRVFNHDDLLAYNFLGGASMCLTYRQHLLDINGFNKDLLSCQDWDLWIKLAQIGSIGTVKEVLVHYYYHKNESISSKLDNVYSGRRNIYFAYRKHMSVDTRRRNVAAIVFIRILMRTDSTVAKLSRLRVLYKDTTLRFFLIYIRIILAGHLKQILPFH